MDKTLIYPTDNALDEHLMKRCQELLLDVAGDCRIVSVSQKPIDFGDNICVGETGRSIRSLDAQLLKGLEAVTTKWVGIAEHDCIYCREHIEYIPSDDAVFHYNRNLWYARYCDPDRGMYSYHGPVLSQLVASADLLRKAIGLRLKILSYRKWYRAYPRGRMGEPGLANREKVFTLISRVGMGEAFKADIEEYLKFVATLFSTKVPCLDVRHRGNFTGERRGTRARWELPYWGKFCEVI